MLLAVRYELKGIHSPLSERPDIRILPTLVPKDWHDRAARVVENQMKLEVERLQERVDLFLDVERDESKQYPVFNLLFSSSLTCISSGHSVYILLVLLLRVTDA